MEKTIAPSNSMDAVVQDPSPSKTADKVGYINNLKVLCTIMVVLHHALVTYGAPGRWYYQQKTAQPVALFLMKMIISTDLSFLMGFFFFISALFVQQSYDKKGAVKFMSDKLKRFGIPLAFYSFILTPVINYLVSYYDKANHYTFFQYLRGYQTWINFGVLWFVAALLLFNMVYVLIRNINGLYFNIIYKIPYGKRLIFVAVLLGLLAFFTRLKFHVGWNLQPVGFQLAHWAQYILMFTAGIIASKNKWLNQLDYKKGITSALIAGFSVVVVLPAIFIIFTDVVKVNGDTFNGGWNLTSLSYCFWEQITGLLIMSGLLTIAKFKWNTPSDFWKWLSANAFGVYILHPLVLTGLALMVKSINVDPAFKFFLIGPEAVILLFTFVSLLRKIPGINQII